MPFQHPWWHLNKDKCVGSPVITGVSNSTTQTPNCAGNNGVWKTTCYVTLDAGIGTWEISFYHSTASSPSWPTDYTLVTRKNGTQHEITANNGEATDGGGAGPVTRYSQWYVELHPPDTDDVCDEDTSNQLSSSSMYSCTV